jgi:sugar phosphate isomerase/epimerase
MMIPTLFSVSYAGLWGQHRLDLKAFFRKAAALGYQAVELMGKRPHWSVLDVSAGGLAEIRDAAAAKVEIATVAGYTNFTLGRDTEVPAVEIQYVRLPRFAYIPGLVNYRRLEDMVRAVPLGDGFLDLDAFFTGLREGGFAGYVAYEMCSPLRGGGSEENLDRAARKSIEKINSWAG